MTARRAAGHAAREVDPPGDATAMTPSFATRLVAWQRVHGRQSLPWQQSSGTRDAYRVWLAEIMLQQTQVAAVIPYYARFLERFPDVHALAAAPADDVLHAWSGLGYYSRARNLQAAARAVVERHGGAFPDDPAALEALPGIGRSTAAAIAAFAFGRRAAILDGNVRRVFARVFAIEGPPQDARTTRRLWTIAEALAPERDIERYTQGLMDLGATLCTPRRPSCLVCPFADVCRARLDGRIDELPTPRTRRTAPSRDTTLLLIAHADRVLLERRPPTGIWGGLWSLPELAASGDAADAIAAARTRAGRFGTVVRVDRSLGFTHAFTHFVLHAAVVEIDLATPAALAAGSSLAWHALAALDAIGLPTPIRHRLAAFAATRADG